MSNVYVSVDLETMSKLPNAAIVSIGAVKFDPLKNEVLDTFKVNIDLDTATAFGGHIEGNTVMWWLQQGEAARKGITDGIAIQHALVAFSEWLTSEDTLPDPNLVMFGNGSKFDLTILESAYRATGISLPWTYRNELCGRTIRALGRLLDKESLQAPVGFAPTGVAHDALDDARWLASEVSWTLSAVKKAAFWLAHDEEVLQKQGPPQEVVTTSTEDGTDED